MFDIKQVCRVASAAVRAVITSGTVQHVEVELEIDRGIINRADGRQSPSSNSFRTRQRQG